MKLKPLIELYRALDRPSIDAGKFVGEIDLTSSLQTLLRDNFTHNKECFGHDFLIEKNFVSSTDDISFTGQAYFTISLPTESGSRFYNNINELINICGSALSKGDIPKEFYLIEDDYYYPDENQPSKVLVLEALCCFLKKLSQLADYEDSKKGTQHKLVFIHSGDGGQSCPIELKTNITPHLLEFSTPNMDLLEELTEEREFSTPHDHAKKTIFSSTITEFLRQTPDDQKAFYYLLENWNQFLRQYENDYSTYLSGFAFHKAKREVVKSEFELADQFSKVLGDINSKLLSVPLSVAGIVALVKTDSGIETLLLLAGLLIVSWLLYEVVKNQKRQLKRITHAKNVAFDSIEGNKDSYPDELKVAVEEMKEGLNEDQAKLETKLVCFSWFSWLPIAAGLVVFLHSTGFFVFFWRLFWGV